MKYVKIGSERRCLMKKPLAYRLRPESIDDIVGHFELLGDKGLIHQYLQHQFLPSLLLFGPPGTGKTTLAQCLGHAFDLQTRFLNAATCSKKDIEAVIIETKLSTPIVLILDEIHRLNKDKQDYLLPVVENGDVILIGLTTTNPYHSINPALRSRLTMLELHPLSSSDVLIALQRALVHKNGLNGEFSVNEDALVYVSNIASGDVRFALNCLEMIVYTSNHSPITLEDVQEGIKHRKVHYDQHDSDHYTTLSALQKSIRGSDVQGAIYYLAKLIKVGDLESLERRLLVIAYEDIGLANPAACSRTIQAIDVAKRVGFPEARIPLAVAVVDLALSPKSKSAEAAVDLALATIDVSDYPSPPYLNLTPVGLQEDEQYDYGDPILWKHLQYLPDELKDLTFYQPMVTGAYEASLAKHFESLNQVKRTSNIKALKAKLKSNRR